MSDYDDYRKDEEQQARDVERLESLLRLKEDAIREGREPLDPDAMRAMLRHIARFKGYSKKGQQAFADWKFEEMRRKHLASAGSLEMD